MPTHFADPSSSRVAAVAASALRGAPAAAGPALPGRSAAGNGGDLTAWPGRNPAAATNSDDVTGKTPGVRVAYIYGYDFAGNPTLTDCGHYCSSDGKLPG